MSKALGQWCILLADFQVAAAHDNEHSTPESKEALNFLITSKTIM
jgi:hypothetical protein